MTHDPLSETGLQRLYVLTGEPSGDAHAAAVVRALKASAPSVEVRGMGEMPWLQKGSHWWNTFAIPR